MNHSTLSICSVAVLGALVAACGGKSAATAEQPAPGGAAATPFDVEAVRAALADTPQTSAPACGDPEDVNTTLGQLFTAQGADLDGAVVDFGCRPADAAGQWQCTWSELLGGTAGYQIMVNVTADGVLVDGSVVCYAPG